MDSTFIKILYRYRWRRTGAFSGVGDDRGAFSGIRGIRGNVLRGAAGGMSGATSTGTVGQVQTLQPGRVGTNQY